MPAVGGHVNSSVAIMSPYPLHNQPNVEHKICLEIYAELLIKAQNQTNTINHQPLHSKLENRRKISPSFPEPLNLGWSLSHPICLNTEWR
jgi:hypothetical protein